HHRWCYTSFPLCEARRMLTILFKQKDHTDIVREELRASMVSMGSGRKSL
ncbi:hypothetical protein FPV67DRAFT_1424547, partial [Lyophyllum atratum]